MKRRLAGLALLGALIGMLAWQVRLENRLTLFFLGAAEPGDQMLEQFQHRVFARRYLIALEPLAKNPAALQAFGHQLLEQLAALEGSAKAWPAYEPPLSPTSAIARYASHSRQIYSLKPEQEAPRLLASEALPKRAALLKQALLSPFGNWIQQIAIHDPLLLTLDAFADWRDKFDPTGQAPADFFPILLESRAQAFEIEAQQQLQQAIRQRFAELNQAAGNRFQLAMTGVPVFAVAAQQQIQRDVSRITVISSLGVILVFLALFRTLTSLLATLLVLVFAFGAGTLVTQLGFGYVHGLTLALGATLIGVCVDYPIHVMAHWQGAKRPPTAIVRKLWPALILGGATTVVGYLALAATGYPGFQQIAVFAATGIACALLVTRYGLPGWLPGRAPSRPLTLPGLNPWLAFCSRHSQALRLTVAILLASALLLLPGLRWLDDLEKLAAIDPLLKQQDQAIRGRLGGIEPGRAVLIEGPDLETALQNAEAATWVLRRLKTEGHLKEFFSPYPWLVSRHLQQRNQQQYQSLLTKNFIDRWHRALKAEGLAVAALGDLSRGDAQWLDNEAMLQSEIAELVTGQVQTTAAGTRLAIWLGPHDAAAVQEALDRLPGVRYFSQRQQLNDLAKRYRRRAVVALLAGLGVILLGLWLRYRKLTKALAVLTPALSGMVFIFAAFALLGQPISFFHLIAALLAIAICVDYGIFFTERRGGDARATYHAMAASMLTTVTAFATLGLAANPMLKMLAVAVTCGVLAGFLLCPVLIPFAAKSTR